MLNNPRISALKASISSYWISNTSCGFPMLEYLKWKLIVSYSIKPFTWDPEVPQYLIFIKRLKPHYKAPGDLQVKIEMAQLLTLCGLGVLGQSNDWLQKTHQQIGEAAEKDSPGTLCAPQSSSISSWSSSSDTMSKGVKSTFIFSVVLECCEIP